MPRVEDIFVKPLVWLPESVDNDGYSSTIAKTSFGFQYDVWRIKEGELWNAVGLPNVDGEPPQFDSREKAISAVNKDYADRVIELVDLTKHQDSADLVVRHEWEWLHKHSLTGADMWIDSEIWMGRKSEIKREKSPSYPFHVPVVGEPVAWMYTLNMEFGQKSVRFASAEADQPFGKPGVDFSEEYTVTITPLYPAVTSVTETTKDLLNTTKRR